MYQDVIVIGSGTSAYMLAHEAIKKGRSVAVIDEREFGGTCALRGCQPKKYFTANAEAVAMAAQLTGIGIDGPPRTVWPDLIALKNEFTDPIPEGTEKGFAKAGMAVIHGRAQFVSEDRVAVGDSEIQGGHIVIATGAIPRPLGIPGAAHCGDSEDFLNLKTLPQRMVFIGGGYISFEFAHVAARAGSRVTILHRSEQVLKGFDPDMVSVLLDATREMGVVLETETEPDRIEKTAGGFRVHAGNRVFDADWVMAAAGRVPNLASLDPDAGGVAVSKQGVTVNKYLQSVSNPKVYAIGDAVESPLMLATVADKQGLVAADNILNGNRTAMKYAAIPTAVFTEPNLAAVGMSETAAERAGSAFRVNRGTTAGWPSSKRIGEKYSGYKVLIETETNTILGAHLCRRNAAETINIFAMAMAFGLTADDLADMLWAYPTYVSDIKYMIR